LEFKKKKGFVNVEIDPRLLEYIINYLESNQKIKIWVFLLWYAAGFKRPDPGSIGQKKLQPFSHC
jgi:hypothetical protein